MQGTDVLIPLAEIAGVFVGFGALIAVRSGATMALSEMLAWTPENQAELDHNLATVPRAKIALVVVPTFWLPLALLVIALALVVLGLFPDQEQALYLTAVALGLYMGALALFVAVFWRPSVPADRAGPAAPGGSKS
jgi:hypothetical protein